MTNALYDTRITVVIRDDTPLIHCGDTPRYRTTTFELTDAQVQALRLNENEEVSRLILEPKREL